MKMDPFQVTWGEVDTRFSYIAICSLALLHSMDKINVDKAVKYFVSCKNLDGGFGCSPGAESHAAQILYIILTRTSLGGGYVSNRLNLEVCYSWWVLSSLVMIDRVQWIHKEKLVKFILDCQDKEKGGISDRPDDAVDVFHTFLESLIYVALEHMTLDIGHDPHLLYTLSGIQVLALFDKMHILDIDKYPPDQPWLGMIIGIWFLFVEIKEVTRYLAFPMDIVSSSTFGAVCGKNEKMSAPSFSRRNTK
ncbi:hypothetical protein TEA_023849 [Camellia sinensis var. sinensis]|uniref:Geranylgeranyl transferase type II subunit beta n=1 Tax=Camellia sinensis var. sinensis TaxID=542762 RepID=A0A4S4DAL6_CAMSN|nr:hypothetical protein TEA_023849 [Camellia sinensis var. sinensis]